MVEKPVHTLKAGLHAKVAAQKLQALNGKRAAVRQRHIVALKNVRDGRHPLDVARVAAIVRFGFGLHAREGVGVDLGGGAGNVRDASAYKALLDRAGEQRQVA